MQIEHHLRLVKVAVFGFNGAFLRFSSENARNPSDSYNLIARSLFDKTVKLICSNPLIAPAASITAFTSARPALLRRAGGETNIR